MDSSKYNFAASFTKQPGRNTLFIDVTFNRSIYQAHRMVTHVSCESNQLF